MSYGFDMGFAQANSLQEAMAIALECCVLTKSFLRSLVRFAALSSKTKHPAPSGVIRATVAC